jgi:hypothetical protein
VEAETARRVQQTFESRLRETLETGWKLKHVITGQEKHTLLHEKHNRQKRIKKKNKTHAQKVKTIYFFSCNVLFFRIDNIN